MDGDLLLSHRSDTTEYIVRRNLISNLKNYQVLALRFLFNCFRIKQSGAILSEDEDMNFEIQVSIFLKAVTQKSRKATPILVLTPAKNLWSWHYHLHKFSGLEVTRISAHNANFLFQKNEHFIILSDENDYKHLRSHRDQNFFIVVVDELDAFANRDLIKGDYNIGLTHVNYLRETDPSLLWKMIRWANPSSVGRVTHFKQDYFACIGNFIPPHYETWYRVTFDFNSSFRRPTADEKDDLETRISNFQSENSDGFPAVAKRTAKKREATAKKPLGTAKKRKHNRVASPWTSDEEPVDVSIFIPSTRNQSNSPKKKFNFNDSSITTSETSFNISATSDEDTKLEKSNKKFNFKDSTVENDYSIPSSETFFNISADSERKDTSKSEKSNKKFSKLKNLNKNLEAFNKRLNKAPALTKRSQKGIRKHVSSNFIEDEVLKEFENDFVPNQKMKKNKSESSLRKNASKVIDKYILEEFSREFNLPGVLERRNQQRMEILGNVSSFFETEQNPRNHNEFTDLDLSKDLGALGDGNLDTSKAQGIEDTSKKENVWTTVINLMTVDAPESSRTIEENIPISSRIPNIPQYNDEDICQLDGPDENIPISSSTPNICKVRNDDKALNKMELENLSITPNIPEYKGKGTIKDICPLENLRIPSTTPNILESKDEDEVLEDTSKSKQSHLHLMKDICQLEKNPIPSLTPKGEEKEDTLKSKDLMKEHKSPEGSSSAEENLSPNISESKCILSSKSIENEEESSILQNGEAPLIIESAPTSPEDNTFLLNIIRGTVKPEPKIKTSYKDDIISKLFGKEESNEITRISSSQKTMSFDVNEDDFLTSLFHSTDENAADTDSLLVSKAERRNLQREEDRRRILSLIFDDEDS